MKGTRKKRILAGLVATLFIGLALVLVPILVLDSGNAEETPEVSTNITIVDSLGRELTIETPVERIVALGNYRCEAVKVLGASDMIVGIDTNSKEISSHYFAELLDRPDVGTWKEPNYEVIASLQPDIVITSANEQRLSDLEEKLAPVGITVIGLDFYREDLIRSEMETLGYLLGKVNEANEYLDWRDHYETLLEEFVNDLSEGEMPTVFMEWGSVPGMSFGKGSSGQAKCTLAGGLNIASEEVEFPTLSMEWLVQENPDVIVKYVSQTGEWGWSSTEEPAGIIDDLADRSGWNLISAVANDRIYVFCGEIAWGLDGIVSAAYWAKWFHPDLDIDPDGVYQEYLERFIGISWPEGRIFAYTPLG